MATPPPPSLVDEAERAAHFAEEYGHQDAATVALIAATLALVEALRSCAVAAPSASAGARATLPAKG